MNSIRYPKSGTNFRVTKRGYVDGIFIIDGKRVFKSLCKMADIQIGPNGKPRTPRQLNAVVQQLWDERRLAIEAEARKQELSDKMMGGLFEAWIQHAEAKRRSPETVRIHNLMRDYYLEMVGDHAIQELVGDPPKPAYDLRRADAYMEGMRKKGIGNARVNSYLGRLSSALRFGYNRGLLDRVPAIERLKVDKKPPKIPTAKQIGQVAKHLDDLVDKTKDRSIRYYYGLHRLLFYLLLGTGMRRGEAFHLRREHVDLENRSIHLIKTKTGDARVCRIPMFLKERLDAHFQAHPGQEWVFEHPKTPGRQAWAEPAAMTTAFKRHLATLGLSGEFKVLHGYRALFSTAGLNNVGVDPVTMKNQLGHADLNTTINYYVAGLQDAQLRAVDAMEEAFFKQVLGRGGG